MRQAITTGALIIALMMGVTAPTKAHAGAEASIVLGYANYDFGDADVEESGFTLGVRGTAYQEEKSGVVWGIGASGLFVDTTKDETCLGGACGEVTAGLSFDVFAMLGYNATPNTRLYTNIGGAFTLGNIEISARGLSADDSALHSGFTVKGGISQRIGKSNTRIFIEGGADFLSSAEYEILGTKLELDNATKITVLSGISYMF